MIGSAALFGAVAPRPTATALSANPTTGPLSTIFTFTATVTVNGGPVTEGSVLFTDGTASWVQGKWLSVEPPPERLS
ncbi:MAG TPA: hypothetical protein VHZ07_12675 [Bryobacteraceae bacterium]|nr:hypothetical protein [Bryobacteraceae bacterium]